MASHVLPRPPGEPRAQHRFEGAARGLGSQTHGAQPVPTIDEADFEAFEGLFETARTRRAAQQRVVEPVDATSVAQRQVYGAILSPRVVRPPSESWTRAAPYEQDLYKVLSKVSSHYDMREEVWLHHWKKLLWGEISRSHGQRSLAS